MHALFNLDVTGQEQPQQGLAFKLLSGALGRRLSYLMMINSRSIPDLPASWASSNLHHDMSLTAVG